MKVNNICKQLQQEFCPKCHKTYLKYVSKNTNNYHVKLKKKDLEILNWMHAQET